MKATTAAEPASHLTVFSTASVIVGLMAAILPLISSEVMLQHIVTAGWIPAVLAARVGWAAQRGAIRQRIVRRERAIDAGDERWGIDMANPRVLTAASQPNKFQLYILLELAITMLVWIAMIGPALFPILMRVSAALGLDSVD